MARPDPSFLLANPDLITPSAPWCVALDNLELGIVLLTQPWVAGSGMRRADIERQLERLALDLPVGPTYFQRVNRAVAKLERIGVLQGFGDGRSRCFVATARGLATLILNLEVLLADPTVDGSEFELKRALVAMCNLVAERLAELPDDLPLDPELEHFFAEVEAIEVLGHRVVTEEIIDQVFDILRLVELQRTQVARRLEECEHRLDGLKAHTELLREVDLGAVPLAVSELADHPAALTAVRHLAATALPELNLGATAIRYRHYLEYLDALHQMYSRQLRVVGLAAVRRLAGRQ